MALDEHQRLLLVEGVVAERDDVGAGAEQVLEDGLGDAEAAGRVLAVDHHEIELVALAQPGQLVDHGLPARPADHVTQEKQSHA